MHLCKFEHPLKIRMASDRSKVHEGQAVQLLLIISICKFYIPWFLQCMRPLFATAWTLSWNAHLAWYLREGFINVTFLGQIKAFWQKLFQTVADFFSHSTEMCSMYWLCKSIFCNLIGKFLQFRLVLTLVLVCNEIELIFLPPK